MNRGNRNHSESGRGGRRGGGGGVFRGGPPNRGDDRLTRADVSLHKFIKIFKRCNKIFIFTFRPYGMNV